MPTTQSLGGGLGLKVLTVAAGHSKDDQELGVGGLTLMAMLNLGPDN